MSTSSSRADTNIKRQHCYIPVVLALVTLPLWSEATHAQRGLAGPVYGRNIEAVVPGGEDLLSQLEDMGWLLRGQTTLTVQARPAFRARGTAREEEFPSRGEITSTQSADLVLGRRLWNNAELIAVPSLARGFGLSDSRGIGAGLNGEAFHGGSATASVALTRLFLRQTFNLSYDAFGQDDDPMRFAGPLALQRVTLTLGKFAVWDIFDNNRYAHDARTQFLSWALVGTGAFDYAGDAAGFTNGVALEWENGVWAVRSGLFQVAREVGGESLDPRVTRAWQGLLQLDRSWWWGRYRGVARLLVGASRTSSARWNDLTAALRGPAERTEQGRGWRTKTMLTANMEQAVNDSLGVFLRLGWNDGQAQNWMFTDMDWSVSAGLAVNGWTWERWEDTLGIGFNVGGLSGPHRRYREVGGGSFVVAREGGLRYAPEVALETYYDAEVASGLHAAVSLQLVLNPGYNADRGPISAIAFRLRAAF